MPYKYEIKYKNPLINHSNQKNFLKIYIILCCFFTSSLLTNLKWPPVIHSSIICESIGADIQMYVACRIKRWTKKYSAERPKFFLIDDIIWFVSVTTISDASFCVFFTSRTNRRHLHEIVHSILLRLFFSVRPQTTLIHIIKWQLLFSLSMMSVASREYEFFFKGEKKRNHQKNSNNFNILSGCTEWRNFFVCLSREFTYKSNELLVNEKGKNSM